MRKMIDTITAVVLFGQNYYGFFKIILFMQQRRNNARQNRYYWQVSNLNIFKVAPCDTDRKIGPLRGHYHFGATQLKPPNCKKNTT